MTHPTAEDVQRITERALHYRERLLDIVNTDMKDDTDTGALVAACGWLVSRLIASNPNQKHITAAFIDTLKADIADMKLSWDRFRKEKETT